MSKPTGGGGGGRGVEKNIHVKIEGQPSVLPAVAIRTTPRSRGNEPKLLGCLFIPYRPSTAGPKLGKIYIKKKKVNKH